MSLLCLTYAWQCLFCRNNWTIVILTRVCITVTINASRPLYLCICTKDRSTAFCLYFLHFLRSQHINIRAVALVKSSSSSTDHKNESTRKLQKKGEASYECCAHKRQAANSTSSAFCKWKLKSVKIFYLQVTLIN